MTKFFVCAIKIVSLFRCAPHTGRQSRRALARIDNSMFSETLEIYDFLEIREVIIPSLRSAQVRSRYDSMFSETLKIYDFLEIREVIIPQFHCAKHNARRSRRASARIDDTMFSEALEIYDFLEIREVIIPSLRSAQVRSRYDSMFSETLKISDFASVS